MAQSGSAGRTTVKYSLRAFSISVIEPPRRLFTEKVPLVSATFARLFPSIDNNISGEWAGLYAIVPEPSAPHTVHLRNEVPRRHLDLHVSEMKPADPRLGHCVSLVLFETSSVCVQSGGDRCASESRQK